MGYSVGIGPNGGVQTITTPNFNGELAFSIPGFGKASMAITGVVSIEVTPTAAIVTTGERSLAVATLKGPHGDVKVTTREMSKTTFVSLTPECAKELGVNLGSVAAPKAPVNATPSILQTIIDAILGPKTFCPPELQVPKTPYGTTIRGMAEPEEELDGADDGVTAGEESEPDVFGNAAFAAMTAGKGSLGINPGAGWGGTSTTNEGGFATIDSAGKITNTITGEAIGKSAINSVGRDDGSGNGPPGPGPGPGPGSVDCSVTDSCGQL